MVSHQIPRMNPLRTAMDGAMGGATYGVANGVPNMAKMMSYIVACRYDNNAVFYTPELKQCSYCIKPGSLLGYSQCFPIKTSQ